MDNPFQPGPPLDGRTRPFGRVREVTNLREAIRTQGAVKVIGQRRAGKTSLFNHIRHSTPDRLLLTLSLQDTTPAPRTPADLARALAPALATALHRPANTPDLTAADDPATALHTLLAAAPRPLILIDEIGHLAAADSDLLSWLRGLGQQHAAMVYFGSRRDWNRVLSRADKVGASFGNDARTIELRPFNEATAIDFLTKTAPPDSITPEHIAWAAKASDGWPFYLQVMGAALFDAHRFQEPVDNIAALYRRELIEGWDQAFVSLWNDLTTEAQALLLKQLDRAPRKPKPRRLPAPDPKLPVLRKQLIDHDLFHDLHGWLVDGPFQDWLFSKRERLAPGESP